MAGQGCDIGLAGLGVMGQNLVLNMANHGFAVAVYNRTAEKTRQFMDRKAGTHNIRAGYDLEEFVTLLRPPRAVLLLVPAGPAVETMIRELAPLLSAGDLIIDGGNSHFSDTDRRWQALEGNGLLFLGLGVSGGEMGARCGPSLMPGGSPEGYERVQSILEAVAARVDGRPCIAYLGPGSAGHYVKMVHNGIEYGVMELIAETYDLMKRGLGLTPSELQDIYQCWCAGELNSYLMEITTRIFGRGDELTGRPLIDLILDQAQQKGTGKWTSWDAMDLQVPTPSIDAAVMMRDLSGYRAERQAAAQALQGLSPSPPADREQFLQKLQNSMYAAMIVTYAQGLALLRRASETYGYALDLEEVSRIWEGGCIIRAALLRYVRAAYQARPDLPHLLLDPAIGQAVMDRQGDWRAVVCAAAGMGLPIPGFMASLAYFDAYRSAWLPANLTQAQRDFFGAHTYARVDRPGVFHTQWVEEMNKGKDGC